MRFLNEKRPKTTEPGDKVIPHLPSKTGNCFAGLPKPFHNLISSLPKMHEQLIPTLSKVFKQLGVVDEVKPDQDAHPYDRRCRSDQALQSMWQQVCHVHLV